MYNILQFQRSHNLFKNNINRNLRCALDNNLAYTFYERYIHFNIEVNDTKLKLLDIYFDILRIRGTETTHAGTTSS